MRLIMLCEDITKGLLANPNHGELERDSLRFHWIKNLDPNIVEINRFTRLVFGLTQSPSILEGTLKQHFKNYMNEYPTLKLSI